MERTWLNTWKVSSAEEIGTAGRLELVDVAPWLNQGVGMVHLAYRRPLVDKIGVNCAEKVCVTFLVFCSIG